MNGSESINLLNHQNGVVGLYLVRNKLLGMLGLPYHLEVFLVGDGGFDINALEGARFVVEGERDVEESARLRMVFCLTKVWVDSDLRQKFASGASRDIGRGCLQGAARE